MSDNITLPRKHIDHAAHALEHFNKDAPDPLVSEIIHHLRTALAAEQPKQEDIEALRRNAARYLYLRNRACHGPHERFVAEYGWFDVSGQHEPGFDAAIDAAMEEKR